MDIGPQNTKCIRTIKTFLIDLNLDLANIDASMHQHSNISFDQIYFYVIALEDRRFLKHRGIDYKSLLRELWYVIRLKKHGGASTIDMQMVRTITGFKNKTIYRKIYEIILAFIINFKYSKKQIIDCYLRYAFFGSGIYGVDQATKKLFNKNKSSLLNNHERAFITSMLLSPKPLHEDKKWKNRILRRSIYAETILSSIKNQLYEF